MALKTGPGLAEGEALTLHGAPIVRASPDLRAGLAEGEALTLHDAPIVRASPDLQAGLAEGEALALHDAPIVRASPDLQAGNASGRGNDRVVHDADVISSTQIRFLISIPKSS